MEWVETTAKTVDEAKDLALDQLGVTSDEAEFEVLDEPRPGLFGRLRGEARVRARVRPASVRPKQTRRGRADGRSNDRPRNEARTGAGEAASDGGGERHAPAEREDRRERAERAERADRGPRPDRAERSAPVRDEHSGPAPTVAEVAAAAESFVGGLASAFGYDVTTRATVEDTEIDVAVDGESLGLLIGPGGRTLLAVQDLARVAAQRRLGDHETRLRVDVSGYREKRRVALERFATTVAEQVRETGAARALDPMPSADRKVIHDALTAIDGVSSRSEGEDPYRRIVVSPA